MLIAGPYMGTVAKMVCVRVRREGLFGTLPWRLPRSRDCSCRGLEMCYNSPVPDQGSDVKWCLALVV